MNNKPVSDGESLYTPTKTEPYVLFQLIVIVLFFGVVIVEQVGYDVGRVGNTVKFWMGFIVVVNYIRAYFEGDRKAQEEKKKEVNDE